MSFQRQHFLLIFILSLSYLKILSVGPARVWTRELPLSRPVERARRRSQQHVLSSIGLYCTSLSWYYLYHCLSCVYASSKFFISSEERSTLGIRGFSRVRWEFSGRRPKPEAVMKTWQKPETVLEKSLAPRVRAKRAARECASEMDGRKEPWQRIEHGF